MRCLVKGLPPRTTFLSPHDRVALGGAKQTGLDRPIPKFDFTVPSREAENRAATLKATNDDHEVFMANKRTYEGYLSGLTISNAVIRSDQLHREHSPSRPGDDLVVSSLGTGSAMPSKYRNGES
jgi:hypothetical protein